MTQRRGKNHFLLEVGKVRRKEEKKLKHEEDFTFSLTPFSQMTLSLRKERGEGGES